MVIKMVNKLQRMMEDNDVFIQIFPNDEGIKLMVCDNQCDSSDNYKINNKEDFIQKLKEILGAY